MGSVCRAMHWTPDTAGPCVPAGRMLKSQYPALLSSAGPSHRKPEGQGPPMRATQLCLTGRRARGKEGKNLEPLPLYR